VGALFIWHRPPLLWLLAAFAVANLAVSPTGVVVPLLVKFNLEPDWTARGYTGGRFQGVLAAKPEYHIEKGFGPKPGTTEWHLTPAGYAVLVQRDLPFVMNAIARAQAKSANR
jgi:hypothetical protein